MLQESPTPQIPPIPPAPSAIPEISHPVERQDAPEPTRCFFQALILFNDGLSKVKCVVKSLSGPGARIEVSGTWYLPHEFDLFIPAKDETFHVAQLSREGDSVMVAFRQAIDVRSIERCERDALQAENANLRRANRLLAERLMALGKVVDLAEPASHTDVPNIFSPR